MALKILNLNEGPSLQDREYLREVYSIVNSPDKEAAIKSLEEFVNRHPGYAPAYNNLGVLHYELGNIEQAKAFYEKAVELEGDNKEFLKNLADLYLVEEGRVEDALRLYIKVLEIDGEDVETYLILGNICANMGQIEDARFFYDKVLEIEPWNLTAMDNLDYLDELTK